jgi:hypothetical protein
VFWAGVVQTLTSPAITLLHPSGASVSMQIMAYGHHLNLASHVIGDSAEILDDE